MTDFNEALPDGSKAVPSTPVDSRQNFVALRERLEKQHKIPANADPAQAGLHVWSVGNATDRDALFPTPEIGFGPHIRSDLPGIVEYHDGNAWIPTGVAVGTREARSDAADAHGAQPILAATIWRDSDGPGKWVWTGSAWVEDYVRADVLETRKDGIQSITSVEKEISNDGSDVTAGVNDLHLDLTVEEGWRFDLKAWITLVINNPNGATEAFAWLRVEEDDGGGVTMVEVERFPMGSAFTRDGNGGDSVGHAEETWVVSPGVTKLRLTLVAKATSNTNIDVRGDLPGDTARSSRTLLRASRIS